MVEPAQNDNPAAALARRRWAKASKAERKRVGELLTEGRRKAAAARGKVRSKRGGKAEVKS